MSGNVEVTSEAFGLLVESLAQISPVWLLQTHPLTTATVFHTFYIITLPQSTSTFQPILVHGNNKTANSNLTSQCSAEICFATMPFLT